MQCYMSNMFNKKADGENVNNAEVTLVIMSTNIHIRMFIHQLQP